MAYVAEIRTTGSDQNGGYFNTGYSGTTDYSQRDTPILSLSDLTTTGSGATSVSSVTGGFTPDMAHNFVNIISGTNFVSGLYEITSVTNSNTVVLSKSPTPNGAGSRGVGNIGGAFATPGYFAGNSSFQPSYAWIRAGTYIISVGTSNVSSGTLYGTSQGSGSSSSRYLFGYYQTRGDNPTDVSKMPYFLYTASTQNVNIIDTGFTIIMNLVIDCNNIAGTTAVNKLEDAGRSDGGAAINVIAKNASYGFVGAYPAIGCAAINCNWGFANSCALGCYAEKCASGGFDCSLASDCIYLSNGGTGRGIYDNRLCENCVVVNSAGDGFYQPNGGVMINCIAVGSAGYGFSGVSGYSQRYTINCAGFSNSSGNYPSGTADPSYVREYFFRTLSNNPFLSSTDFSLNAISGGGLELRGSDLVGKIPPPTFGFSTATTFKRDVGAGQHSETGVSVAPGWIKQIRGEQEE